jgi:hemerythrin-like metal-binding protein
VPRQRLLDHAVGVASIDEEQAAFHLQVTRLRDAMRGRRPADLPGLFAYLEHLARNHFAEEERLMALGGYPDLDAHRREHAEFAVTLAELRGRFGSGGPTLTLTVELATWLGSWLRGHVREQDRALGRFLSGPPRA